LHDLIAMEASELAHFHELLMARRQAILRTAREDLHRARAARDTPDPGDEADEAEDVQQRDLSLVLDERSTRFLGAIDDALERLRKGSYGECVECGRPIERERLDAVPWAVRCADDQEAFEGEQAAHAPPTL
jgi:RNA polymerase-binding transcription factor